MAQSQVQQIVQREQIEHQLVLNRAHLQEIEENLATLTEQRKVAKVQIASAKTALEGYDMGYIAGQHAGPAGAKQAKTLPIENEEN